MRRSEPAEFGNCMTAKQRVDDTPSQICIDCRIPMLSNETSLENHSAATRPTALSCARVNGTAGAPSVKLAAGGPAL
jgi:hypothetical protein